MAILIQPYRQEHEAAVVAFNRRLQSGGAEPDLVFYEHATPTWLPPDGNSVFNQYFVAVENNTVRGAYALKWQNFWFADGTVRAIAYYHHPLSEGIINKSYALVGTLLLRDAMQRAPLLYCLGMGGYVRPLPKMLIGLGWAHCLVPFYFRVVRPYRFLRQMQALRTSFWRKLAMDLAAFSGAGWAGAECYRMAVSFRNARSASHEVKTEREFSDWVNPLWERARLECAMAAVRDSATLARLYPAGDSHFTRLKISRRGGEIGWAVVGERRKDSKYGSLRVGSVVDCLAASGDMLPVVQAASNTLEELGMDLIVTNQSHQAWCRAFEAAGFFKAESNFIFAASKKLAELLDPFAVHKACLHFTRADGDGLPRNF